MRALLRMSLLAATLLAMTAGGCGKADKVAANNDLRFDNKNSTSTSASPAPVARGGESRGEPRLIAENKPSTPLPSFKEPATPRRAAKPDSPIAGTSAGADLVVAEDKVAKVVIAVAKDAGKWEGEAAKDLAKYIALMTGAAPQVVNGKPAASQPAIIVGKMALEAKPDLNAKVQGAAKKHPFLRADAIVVQRDGNHVYVAGTNDDSHYYAAAWLLNQWGCRWYFPTEFGECIPKHATLKVGKLDHAYGTPFEVRRYWIAWNGDGTGQAEFTARNFMNQEIVPNGHNLGGFTKEVEPAGKGHFAIPITDPKTAEGVAKKIENDFRDGKRIQLGIEDGLYTSDYPRDAELLKLKFDKYFMTPSYTDCFMTFYNNVAETLLKKYPNSKAMIGFLAYANLTLPPVQVTKAASPLVAYLAPIDFDPIHGMDSPLSGPRRELKDILYQWVKVMDGRVVIYDYDQGMLVWRDMPNPSHQAFRNDVKHYAKAGVLGIDTESRNAIATTFLNLFFRGQLKWDPNADTDALLADFYPKFYGPAAEPMARYWDAIFKTWESTIVTEHEYFVAQAIYTPELLASLKKNLEEAEAIVAQLPDNAQNKMFKDRMKFTRLSYGITDNYMAMVRAAVTDIDYPTAVARGTQGLALREQLTDMNGIFTSYRVGKNEGEGYPWFPGEVKQYKELQQLIDGTKGTLVTKLPLVWNYRRDPKNVGEKEGWLKQPADLKWWNDNAKLPIAERHQKNTEGNWEEFRTDEYLQAQGLITPDHHSYTGYGWYRVEVDLTADQIAGNVKLKFPGVFNTIWVYANDQQVGHRPQKDLWWYEDYRFEYEADLKGKLKPGKNVFVVRHYNPHHFGGMFRRPFLYRAK